jgi:hypothetical protein
MLPCFSKTLFEECWGCGFHLSFLQGVVDQKCILLFYFLLLLPIPFHLAFKRTFSQKLVLIIGMSNVIFISQVMLINTINIIK